MSQSLLTQNPLVFWLSGELTRSNPKRHGLFQVMELEPLLVSLILGLVTLTTLSLDHTVEALTHGTIHTLKLNNQEMVMDTELTALEPSLETKDSVLPQEPNGSPARVFKITDQEVKLN
jgi:hypothetical protein